MKLLTFLAVILVCEIAAPVPALALADPPTPTATATLCPVATPEPLWVEPVISPTDLLSQTIVVRIGNGEAVTVTAESGVFTVTGAFNAYGAPALAPVTLLPAQTHHLSVQARVRTVYQWGCRYGGYTLSADRDRYGQPLVIRQAPILTVTPTPRERLYLPLILRAAQDFQR